MSDHSKAEGHSDVFRGSEIRRPQDPHQLQRMEHGKHINSILSPSAHRNLADNPDVHKEECAKRCQSQLAQFWKSKGTGIGNGQISNYGPSPVMSDALHPAEGMTAGKGTINVTKHCLRKENTRAFEAERVILSKTSAYRMESSRVGWKSVDSSPFLHLGIVSSDGQQYAEFNVNQKTQSIVRSKRKYGGWDAGLDRVQLQTTQPGFASAPDDIKSMPKEFLLQGEYMVQRSSLYRFFEKKRLPSFGPSQNECTGPASSYELGGFSRMPDAGSPILTREENIHSISGTAYSEKLANHNSLNMENGICGPCNFSLRTFSQKKGDTKLNMGCSRPVPRDQSPKAHGDSPIDVSGSELLLAKRSNVQGFVELNESFCEQHFQQSVPGFSINEVGALKRCTTIDSIGRTLGISINNEEGGQSVNAYSTDVQNESHVRAACLDIDAHRVKSLPEGVNSARSDKKDFTGMQNLRKPGAVDPKGLSTSRMDSMEVEHIISQIEKPKKSDFSHQLENQLSTEVSSRWVKRLKVSSDSVETGTKDYHMEDVLTTRRVHKLLSRVMNYSRSNSFTLVKCLQENQQFEKTVLFLRNNDSPVESLKETYPWIQRWCQKSEETACPKTRKPIEVLCEPEKTKPLPENLEGKLFPSLAAMALMGKAINNFRPCEFRRRGSSLVWNTEQF